MCASTKEIIVPVSHINVIDIDAYVKDDYQKINYKI